MADGIEFDVRFKIDEVESRMKKIEDSIANVANNADKHTKRMEDAFHKTSAEANNLDSAIRNIGAAVIAYLSINSITSLGRGIIEVRSEFEKFTSVLKTAYGSSKQADEAMQMLKQTAVETPFQLTELAQAFVLLKNRGVDPTKASLIKAGDFASSTGRTFQELSEALLNIGELEVWKKFGVNASLQGDKIKLSFRGVTEEVEKSTAGVLKAVESFGSMEGISGSMKGQMETLGGKVSNLKDAWDQLLNKLGESQGFKSATEGLITLTEATTKFIDTVQTINSSENLSAWQKLELILSMMSHSGFSPEANATAVAINKINGTAKSIAEDYIRRLSNTIKDYKDVNKATEFLRDEQLRLEQHLLEAENQGFAKSGDASKATILVSLRKEIIAIQELLKSPTKVDKILFGEKDVKDQVKLIGDLETKLKELATERTEATSKSEIAAIDRQTEAIKKQINTIEAGVRRINDLKYMSKAPDDTKVKQSFADFYNQQLGIITRDKYTGIVGLANQAASPNPADVNHYNYLRLNGLDELGSRMKLVEASIVKDHEKMLNDLDQMNREALKKELAYWKTRLDDLKFQGADTKKAEEAIKKIEGAINDDTNQRLNDMISGVHELASVVGGELGKSLTAAATGVDSIFTGLSKIDNSKSIFSSISGGISVLSGGLTIVETVFGQLSNLFESESSSKMLAYYAAQQRYLENITKLIEAQTASLKDLQGVEKITNKDAAIANLQTDLNNIENQAKSNVHAQEIIFRNANSVAAKAADLSKMSMADLIAMRDDYLTNKLGGKYAFLTPEDFQVLDDYVNKYQEVQDKIKEIQNSMNADLTGTTYDSLLSAIQDAFADGTMSAEEFSTNFEDLMKKSVLNSFSRQFLEKQLQGWYDEFAAASKSDGKLTDEEITKLRADLQQITNDAQIGLKNLTDAAGIDLSSSSSSSSALSGAVKSISEDSANLIAGQMNATRIIAMEQKNIATEGYKQLVLIERNTRPIAEIRDLLKNMGSNQLITERANGW
jgi:Mu-like prophage protein